MARKILAVLAVSSMALASASYALIPDLALSTATTGATETVSVFSIPDGSGNPLSSVFIFGGSQVNGTVTVTLVDDSVTPIFNWPFEDLWIESNTPDIVLCQGGSVADGPTNVNGQATFSGPLQAGGWGEGLVVWVGGVVDSPLSQTPLDYLFNSPDMNLDLIVNLTDIVLFAQIYFEAYDYQADYYYDGVINLSDIVLLAQGSGGACP